MSIGLAGIGREDDWQVDLDEMIGLDLYGITIANRQFSLQIFEVRLDAIKYLQLFLKESEQDKPFHFHTAFGGRLEFVSHDGNLLIRIFDAREHGANLLTITVQPAERTKLAAALEEAIEDAT